jgi:head-tail adaptor
MKAPRLNLEVVLENPVRTADGAGGYSESWQALGTLWAQILPGSGREANGPAGAVSLSRHRVILRAAPVGQQMRPVAGQRLRLGTRRLAVEAVTELPDQPLYLRCDVTEETAT